MTKLNLPKFIETIANQIDFSRLVIIANDNYEDVPEEFHHEEVFGELADPDMCEWHQEHDHSEGDRFYSSGDLLWCARSLAAACLEMDRAMDAGKSLLSGTYYWKAN